MELPHACRHLCWKGNPSQFRVKSSTLIYSTGKSQVPSIPCRVQTFNFLCADARRQTHADIRRRMQTHAKFFSCILCPSCYSPVLFTHRNDIFYCYLHVNSLRCEFQLLYILAILKKPLCDITDNMMSQMCTVMPTNHPPAKTSLIRTEY